MLAGVVVKVLLHFCKGVVPLEVEREGIKHNIGLLNRYGAIHAGIFLGNICSWVVGDENVGGDSVIDGIAGRTEQLAEEIEGGEGITDGGHGKAAIVDVISVFVRVSHVSQSVICAVPIQDVYEEGGNRSDDWQQFLLEVEGVS